MSHKHKFSMIATLLAFLLVTSMVLQGQALAQSPETGQDDSALRQFMRAVSPDASEDEESGDSQRSEIEEFIETDRNSFTFARMTAGANRLIVESSYSFIDLNGEKIKNSFPELLMRYGIGDRFELRLGWNYESGRERKPDAGNIAGFFGADAEQQIFYGFKAL